MKARNKACKIIAKESQNQKDVLIFHKKFYILYDSNMQVNFSSSICCLFQMDIQIIHASKNTVMIKWLANSFLQTIKQQTRARWKKLLKVQIQIGLPLQYNAKSNK